MRLNINISFIIYFSRPLIFFSFSVNRFFNLKAD